MSFTLKNKGSLLAPLTFMESFHCTKGFYSGRRVWNVHSKKIKGLKLFKG